MSIGTSLKFFVCVLFKIAFKEIFSFISAILQKINYSENQGLKKKLENHRENWQIFVAPPLCIAERFGIKLHVSDVCFR